MLITNTFFLFLAEMRFAAPAELLLNVPTNLVLAWKVRRAIDARFVLTAFLFVPAGILGGARILRGFQPRVLLIGSGAALAAANLGGEGGLPAAGPSMYTEAGGESK